MTDDIQLSDLPKSTVADRISDAVKQLRTLDSPLGFGLWDTRTADRRGEVMDAIKGTGGQVKHIKDGYQYVGGFPAHMWRLATADDHYKTLRYGIKQFRKEWEPIRDALVKPYHYVSIGQAPVRRTGACSNTCSPWRRRRRSCMSRLTSAPTFCGWA